MSYSLKAVSHGVTFDFNKKAPVGVNTGLTGQNISYSTTAGAERVGVEIGSHQVEAKEIGLSGTILGDATETRKEMINLFRPNEVVQIVYNGKFVYDCYVKKTPTIGMEKNNPAYSGLTLISPNPYPRSPDLIMESLLGLRRLFKFPWHTGQSIKFSEYDTEVYKNIYSTSSVPVGWVWELYASFAITGPKLLNFNTGEFVRLRTTIAQGERAVVDATTKEIEVYRIDALGNRTRDDGLLDMYSTPFRLTQGDNLLKTEADDGVQWALSSIKRYDRYLGVWL